MVDCAWKNFANRLAEIAVAYKSKLLYMVHVAVSVFSAPQWCSQRQNLKVKASTFEAKTKAVGPETKDNAIKFGVEAPRGQGLALRTTLLLHNAAIVDVCCQIS